MNNLFIGNRQSYKSTMALNKFMENPQNSLLVVLSNNTKKCFQKMLENNYELSIEDKESIKNRIQAPCCDAGRGMQIENLIFDEFFYLHEEQALVLWQSLLPCVQANTHGSISIYSSLVPLTHPDRLRQEKFIEVIKTFSNWRVVKLKTGEEEEPKIKPWLFNY